MLRGALPDNNVRMVSGTSDVLAGFGPVPFREMIVAVAEATEAVVVGKIVVVEELEDLEDEVAAAEEDGATGETGTRSITVF